MARSKNMPITKIATIYDSTDPDFHINDNTIQENFDGPNA